MLQKKKRATQRCMLSGVSPALSLVHIPQMTLLQNITIYLLYAVWCQPCAVPGPRSAHNGENRFMVVCCWCQLLRCLPSALRLWGYDSPIFTVVTAPHVRGFVGTRGSHRPLSLYVIKRGSGWQMSRLCHRTVSLNRL